MVKHETDYDRSDAAEFEPDWRATVEAQIVNHNDEIAYLAADLDRHVLVRRFIDRTVRDLVDTTRGCLETGTINSVQAVRGAPENLVGPSDQMRKDLRELSSFLYEHFYFNRRIRRMAAKAGRVLKDMFEAYLDEPKQMPPEVLARADEKGLERTVCDYLAGMTDRFALEEHGRLFDPAIRV